MHGGKPCNTGLVNPVTKPTHSINLPVDLPSMCTESPDQFQTSDNDPDLLGVSQMRWNDSVGIAILQKIPRSKNF
jgi:hypothetical protein